MPSPISSNRAAEADVSGYYDADAQLCVSDGAPTQAQHPPTTARAPGRDGDPADAGSPAVTRLVAKHTRAPELPAQRPPHEDCSTEVLKAALSCGITAIGAVVGSATGPGELAIIAMGGARCAVDATEAYECLSESP